MKKNKLHSAISCFLAIALLFAMLPPMAVPAQAGGSLPSGVDRAKVVWDLENAPDNMTDWAIDRFKEEWGGDYGVSAGQWTPKGVNGKGVNGSRALQWDVHGNAWGSTSYIVLSKDSTAVTDWTGAENLYFYIDASEQPADFKADLLLYTKSNGMIEMVNGAPYAYWNGSKWVDANIDDYHHLSISAGYVGWIRLPLASVYNNPSLNEVQRLGFLLEHHKVGASVYFDHFAVDKAVAGDPMEIGTAVTVWDMENLPDSFNDWCIDKYVEIGWRQDGEVGVSGGFWTPSGQNGKGYKGSRALAWTQNSYLWGNTSYIVLANDKTAVTDWRGAENLYFYIDASQITENFALDILLYTEGSGEREMIPGAAWYYWSGTKWVASTIDEWHHTIINAGYTGWIRLPLAQVYGSVDMRNIRRIGFLAEHHMEDAAVYLDHFAVDKVTSAPSFSRTELNQSLTDINLIPDAPVQDSADYFCTWNTQGNTCGPAGVTVRDILTHETLFGEDGWAYLYTEEVRKDLIFVLDDGWDLPYSENGVDNGDFYGSFILDETKFPGYGQDYAERMKTLVDKLKAAGWKGVGVWVCCQEDAAHKPTNGTWDKDYWNERILWCKEAGITYWKIDWGNYYPNVEWRRFISDTAQRIHPQLIIEHITGDVGTNDPLGAGTVQKNLDKMVTVAGFSDVFRTYDVTTQLSLVTTMERVARLLEAGHTLQGEHMGLVNCEDELYLAAALGLSAGVMRSKFTGMSALEEVTRGILWHRLAPSFELAGYDVQVSDTVLSDAWYFNNDTWDATINGKTVTQYAPAAVSRGIALPVVTSAGEVPFLAASRNPVTGAISIGSFRRTSVGSANHLVYADVSLNVGKLTGPIGIFGVYESLTLTFDENMEGRRILAQDLMSKKAFDITRFVSVSGGTVKIQGDLLKYIGLYSGNVNDTSEPGLVLQIGDSADYAEIPAMNERTEGGEYTVKLPTGTGFTVTGNGTTVRHSKDFTFSVKVSVEGKAPVVKANGVELIGRNGVYTIENVVCDQQITVTLEDVQPPAKTADPFVFYAVIPLCVLSALVMYIMIWRKKKA